MFKNRSIQVRMVKDAPGGGTEPVETVMLDPEQINEILKDQIEHTAKAVVGVYAAMTALRTISTVIINAAPKR